MTKFISSATSSVNNINKAFIFAGFAKRMYSSKGLSGISEDLESEFRRKFDPISEEFSAHKALKHPMFEYLQEQSKEGFTSKQFEIYRDNFFRRTELTIPSVARFIEKAALSGDGQAVVDTLRNLNDESGYGDINKMHSNLLLKSHNIHGMRVFNIDPINPIANVAKSQNLVNAVEIYRREKQQSFDKSYPYIAGNAWAHELAADDMLDNFRKAFFVPYQGFYTPKEYSEVTEFFTAHKDDSIEGGDIEAQHERMARGAAERACKDALKNISDVRDGGLNFLDCQKNLWDEMLIKIEKAKEVGKIVRPEVEIISEKSPSSSLKPIGLVNLQDETKEKGGSR